LTLSDLSPVISGIGGLLGIISIAYTWITARSRVNGEEIKVLRERSVEHDRRIDRIEKDIEHLPDRNHAQTMQLELAQMSGEIRILAERLKPVTAISERLQEFLLEEAKARRSAS
jgi:hypothetical protein